MAIISGLLHKQPWQGDRIGSGLRLLGDMAWASCGSFENGNWQFLSEISGRALMGWAGWSRPNIASVEGVTAVLDGFIFNRADLGEASNDAELFICLYRRYGLEEALQKVNGDFALALNDSGEDTLCLARDRLGVRPLYYTATPDFLSFASRPYALTALAGVSGEVEKGFLAAIAAMHYRYFDNIPQASPYTNISQVPAGTGIRFKGGKSIPFTYWILRQMPDFKESEAELAGRYRDLLRNAVALRLDSASNPAFTLSGGMDSSSVLASAVLLTGRKQNAFSSVYVDKTFDESEDIRSMLDSTVRRWYPVEIDAPDIFELVKRMVRIHNEPVATATWLSHFLLCEKVAEQGFRGLFGGLGGDELNAGEYEYFIYFFADLKSCGQEQLLAHEAAMWIHYHDHPIFKKSLDVIKKGLAELTDPNRPGKCLPNRARLMRYASALDDGLFDMRAYAPVMDHPFSSYLKNRTYQDMFRETLPCCLRAENRQAAAFGLDNFLPFLDYRLIEFMFRIPATLKIKDGVTKYLLREAMRGTLPEETRTRVKKTGWNAPAHVWFSGKKLEPVLDLIRSKSFGERGIYKAGEVERIIKEHDEIVSSEKPAENHMMFLWQLINLELWLQDLASVGTGAVKRLRESAPKYRLQSGSSDTKPTYR